MTEASRAIILRRLRRDPARRIFLPHSGVRDVYLHGPGLMRRMYVERVDVLALQASGDLVVDMVETGGLSLKIK